MERREMIGVVIGAFSLGAALGFLGAFCIIKGIDTNIGPKF